MEPAEILKISDFPSATMKLAAMRRVVSLVPNRRPSLNSTFANEADAARSVRLEYFAVAESADSGNRIVGNRANAELAELLVFPQNFFTLLGGIRLQKQNIIIGQNVNIRFGHLLRKIAPFAFACVERSRILERSAMHNQILVATYRLCRIAEYEQLQPHTTLALPSLNRRTAKPGTNGIFCASGNEEV